MKEDIITYLESKVKITKELEKKHRKVFEKQAAYFGNGVYGIPATNIFCTDTWELFLRFVAAREGIRLSK